MARKPSPQKRYQNALRVLKRRLGVSHREAQGIYRLKRQQTKAPVSPTTFRNYAKSTLQKLKRQARTKAPPPKRRKKRRGGIVPPKRGKVLFDGDIASFMLRHQTDVQAQDASKMRVRIRPFWVGAKRQTPITVDRDAVSKGEFWKAYHDAVRSAIKTATGKQGKSPEAVFTETLEVFDNGLDDIEDLYPEYF